MLLLTSVGNDGSVVQTQAFPAMGERFPITFELLPSVTPNNYHKIPSILPVVLKEIYLRVLGQDHHSHRPCFFGENHHRSTSTLLISLR